MTSEIVLKKLEAAAEGSWELDADILLALGLKGQTAIDDEGAPYERLGDHQHFTRSVDAALRLVPRSEDGKHAMYAQIECHATGRGNCGIHPFWQASRADEVWSREQATPAIAVCVAAVKVRIEAKKRGWPVA